MPSSGSGLVTSPVERTAATDELGMKVMGPNIRNRYEYRIFFGLELKQIEIIK
jgi:hypothetical protein